MKKHVHLSKVAEKLNLKNLTPEIDISQTRIYTTSVNRPSLLFAGYYDYLDKKRILIIGRGEDEFLKTKPEQIRKERYKRMIDEGYPAIIFARNITPEAYLLEIAKEANIPILQGEPGTSQLIVNIILFLSEQLAPVESVYGVLVDVYGEGIIITGESGIGKSETAIELIKRGHRLVADDIIEISKLHDGMLIGRAPEMTQHMIELRGIGILDAKALFGVESIRESKQIDMIINLEEMDDTKVYDRLGLNEEYRNILGVPVLKHSVPVRPGRNLAIIIEAAAVNNRQKKMGYNAAQELCNRVSNEINSKSQKSEE